MARPLRRVLIGLAIRTGIDLRAIEQYDMPTIRGFLAMLDDMNKPPGESASMRGQQTPEEMMAAVGKALGAKR